MREVGGGDDVVVVAQKLAHWAVMVSRCQSTTTEEHKNSNVGAIHVPCRASQQPKAGKSSEVRDSSCIMVFWGEFSAGARQD